MLLIYPLVAIAVPILTALSGSFARLYINNPTPPTKITPNPSPKYFPTVI